MRPTHLQKNEALHAKLESDVETFLANGGLIHQVQREETKWYRDLQDKKPGVPVPMRIRSGGAHIWDGSHRTQ